MKKNVLVFAIIIFIGLILYIGIAIYSMAGFSLVSCENTLIEEVDSPDGVWKIVVFDRGCGATTGFSTQVDILKATESLKNESGDLLVLEGKHVPIVIFWETNKKYSLKYNGETYNGTTK